MNRITGLIVVTLLSVSARADMTTFLKSCGYGTLAGAALGLASLAVSENPSGKINNVARGASLGLYAGIGYGAYLHYKQQTTPGSIDISQTQQSQHVVYLSPVFKNQRIGGMQANLLMQTF
jgi:hypothetical protein